MAATTATSGCKTTTATAFFRLSSPKPPPSQKFSPFSKQLISSYRCSISSVAITQSHISSPASAAAPPIGRMIRRSVSSPETSVVEEENAEESGNSGSLPSLTGCKACGREDIERGCNGKGRIQGGIAVVPGFGWWPIKAYRPCPAYVASGGRYRRRGQSMDEVISGNGVRDS
ncbi:hypothetical protein ABFS82_05G112200 [Erythranthe guttata]|uniref:Uncharacterized protein n=1 Tax=Erythranthe guttata TaxID=4155 RepID=A0A022QGQ1_ERYGU|nr:PREDICTED: uncharacterized protein LOC105970256 [Erythranthe guttata]XP_012850520.1 PREDICTED: uncharacterized protein LOC105970256 [Erythranthe guttata]EYU26418.1 hypothetical protein MIMGU_mgv1a014952mg [Erythranthe guttata]|eukprot:XP_012850519.1 PREDICTED: uncharacterized protein LOC105970256 [Erythranthe guttata]